MMVEMKVPLAISFIAEPVVSSGDKVMAMEVLSRFCLSESSGRVLFPPEFLFKRATPAEKERIFVLQLDAVLRQAEFFKENKVICTLNADRDIAQLICDASDIRNQLLSMPFIRLEISETFCGMSGPTTDPLLSGLSCNFGLWLDDFGAGHANLSALQSGLFETVKIDKAFFWKNSDKPLWPVILRELRRHVSSIVVEGVENRAQTEQLKGVAEGMQGYLFPSVFLNNPAAALERAHPAGASELNTLRAAARSGNENP